MTIGSDIKTLRAEYGLTQVQLAKILGVSAQTIYYWEGDQFQPAPHHLQNLAQMWNAQFDGTHREQIVRWINARLATPDATTPSQTAVGAGSALLAAAAAIGVGLLLGSALAADKKPKQTRRTRRTRRKSG